ncbi:GFA family protein [Lentibacter algarum]|uniref:GFA family protein n=1 Tax=Lentibacter algarum TaxID=576131 RepID=UPI001C0750C9|nr:GFA family protein [Lentibacter algarum]MBU2981773.1 GFA family protein [Lentibacter algarum]
MRLTGSCLCGAVGFELEGWVSPIQACHAERCRKATGGLFSPEVAAAGDKFVWTGEVGNIASYEAPLLDTPPAYRRNFCRTCGSPLPVEHEGMIVLQAGVLDNCSELDVFRHAFVGQKSGCCEITDGKPQFEGQPPVPDVSELHE